MTSVRIRDATPVDADAIARVHVEAWRESYRGLVPDAAIEALSVERTSALWSSIFDEGQAVFVVEDESGIAGVGAAAPARDATLGADGEVTAMYLKDRVKRRGVGRRLLGTLMRSLAARGCRSAGVWVLTDNHAARRFYEALGSRPGPTRVADESHVVMHEIAYVWDDLTRFMEHSGL